MVGGERSIQNDSTKGSARALISKPLTPSVALSSGQDTFAFDKIFALIDEYICADSLLQNFPFQSRGGSYISRHFRLNYAAMLDIRRISGIGRSMLNSAGVSRLFL
jgi:hypothetical protein